MVATNCSAFSSSIQGYFQSAFHRGNGCYNMQWRDWLCHFSTFSPLFIAAMVATCGRGSVAGSLPTFSPLFIAAMVATLNWMQRAVCHLVLSVRFSSRQWLLLCNGAVVISKTHPFSPLFIAAMVATLYGRRFDRSAQTGFQSAFHRGNGCYFSAVPSGTKISPAFQSAFHRGNGCYLMAIKRLRR